MVGRLRAEARMGGATRILSRARRLEGNARGNFTGGQRTGLLPIFEKTLERGPRVDLEGER